MSAQNSDAAPIRVGIFRDDDAAQSAVEALLEAGFPQDRISVICPDCSTDAFPSGVQREEPAGADAPKAAATGGAAGAILGGLAAAVGISLTGGGGLLVAGPVLGAAGAGGVAGGFVGAMATRGFDPEIADYYDQALTKGRILVAVDTAPAEGETVPGPERAERVFEACGAEPISLRDD